jgi:hypothetical protein
MWIWAVTLLRGTGQMCVDIGCGIINEPRPPQYAGVRLELGDVPHVACRACGWATEAASGWQDQLVRLGE